MTTTRSILAAVLAVLFAFSLLSTPASAAPPADTCPQIVPKGDLAGLVGDAGVEGWTVFSGTTSRSFPVEVISVQDNAWEPDDQIIWAEASGPDIDAIGGIAFGMSGSPVYTASGELIGALAYGLSANTKVFGITPAYQMTSALPDTTVTLSQSSRRAIERATGQPAAGPRLLAPVMQTNARGPIADRLRASLAKQGIPLVSTTGSSARSVAPLPGATVEAGGVLVGSLALGRTNFSGLGTATYVCDNKVLGFGHPFFGDVNARGVLSNGEVYATIEDSAWGPYKYGVPTTPFGTMTRDNTYGIGGTIGTTTPTIDMSGRVGAFEGQLTQVAKMPINSDGLVEDPWSGAAYLALAPAFALSAEIYKFDSEFWQLASASGGWTIKGTADGKPFSFVRSDSWSGREGDPAGTLLGDLNAMVQYGTQYGSTGLDIDSIEPNLDLFRGLRSYNLSRVDVRVGKSSWRKNPREISVRKGQSFFVRLSMRPNSGESLSRVLHYRSNGRSGFFSLQPMQQPEPDQFGVASFEDLLQDLGAVKNTRLEVDVSGGKYVAGSTSFDRVVSGNYSFDIRAVKKKK